MKLQLLIPQFNETDEVMRPMLESISTQQGVNLKQDIEVLIGNDGSDIRLSEEFLGSFSFPFDMFSSIIPVCPEPVDGCLIWLQRTMLCFAMRMICF